MTGVYDKASKASKARKCQADWRRRACKARERGDRLPKGEEDEGLGS